MKSLKIRLPRKLKKQIRKKNEYWRMMSFLKNNGKRKNINVMFKFSHNQESVITF